MEENKNLTAERSLEIITEQIEGSRRTITQNSSKSLICWGVCVFVFALLIAYLWKNCGGPVWNILWGAMWLFGCLGEWLISKHKEPVGPSFVGKTVGQVWATFGIFIGAIGLFFCLNGLGLLSVDFTLPHGHLYINLTSIISLCFGIASTTTGAILKNAFMQICGLIAGLGGFFVALLLPGVEQLYVMAAVALVGLILPGVAVYLRNKK